jgi:hypothetical protein
LGQEEFQSAGEEDYLNCMNELKASYRETTRNIKKEQQIERERSKFRRWRSSSETSKEGKNPLGEYNKLKLRKIRPCKILKKNFANAYEIELLEGVGISPIFYLACPVNIRMPQ